MANEEHLKILKQGVEAWNTWRKKHPNIKVDLRGADLDGADLSETDLSEADLTLADLSRANLSNADLTRTILDKANLSKANLSKAWLGGALMPFANLNETDLSSASLFAADLIGADLCNAILTGAFLYGTARDNWSIEGVTCNYVYFDFERTERTPKDRDFAPGEFEELYKQLPTFEYYFEQGFTPVDAVIMNQTVQTICTQHPEIELRLDSFHSRSRPHAVFTVLQKKYIEEALKQVAASYEKKLAVLEGKREQLLEVFTMLTDKPQYAITGLETPQKSERAVV